MTKNPSNNIELYQYSDDFNKNICLKYDDLIEKISDIDFNKFLISNNKIIWLEYGFIKSRECLCSAIQYPIANDEEYIFSNDHCYFDEKIITIEYKNYINFINNDINVSWYVKYYCDNGWNLKNIIMACKYHYLVYLVEKYKKTKEWVENINDEPKLIDALNIVNTGNNILNEVSETNYIADLLVTKININELYITWNAYS